MSKMTRGAFRLGRGHVEVTGQLSPFLRFCEQRGQVHFLIAQNAEVPPRCGPFRFK